MSVLLGPYVITRRIGAGGMGVVYEAIDLRQGQRVALKTLERMDASGLYRLKNEFRSVADVTHPNLAALYELVREEGVWFFTMELVDGVSFVDHVSAGGLGAGADDVVAAPAGPGSCDPGQSQPQGDAARTLRSGADAARTLQRDPSQGGPPGERTPGARPEARTGWRWGGAARGVEPARRDPQRASGVAHRASAGRIRQALLQLASAVNTLHRAGKLHRDIKPANLLVSREGRVVVLDFGLVSDARGGRDRWGVAGTPGYMAPEQAAGGGSTTASDWYAVGSVLYQALTGRLPFPGTQADEILSAKLCREPAPPSAIARGVPPDLDALCVALLRRRPQDRPTGAEILCQLKGAPAVRAGFPSGEWAAARRTHSDPPPSSGPAALLGRDVPLEALLAAQAAVAPGAPVTVHVRGRPGMGKTALVQHFVLALRRGGIGSGGRLPTARDPLALRWPGRRPPPSWKPAADAPADAPKTVRSPPRGPSFLPGEGRAAGPPAWTPAVVLCCRCHERESVPYKVIDSLIDALTRHLRELSSAACAALLPPRIADLAALFPVLDRVEAIAEAGVRSAPDSGAGAPAPPEGPAWVRRGASGALRALLRNLAAAAPLVIAIDDLQWGDLESARLLRELLSPPDAPGLLFVAAYRSDGLDRSAFLQELLADPPCEARTIELGPLPLEAAERLALSRLGLRGADAEACAARIASEADGSPFLVEEVVRYAARPGRELRIVPTLDEVLAARLSELSPEARRLLEVVAVAGGPVPRRAALDAADVGLGGARALQLLCVGGLLWTGGVRDQDVICTYHDRIRDVVLAALPPEALAGYRAALARARGGEGGKDAALTPRG